MERNRVTLDTGPGDSDCGDGSHSNGLGGRPTASTSRRRSDLGFLGSEHSGGGGAKAGSARAGPGLPSSRVLERTRHRP